MDMEAKWEDPFCVTSQLNGPRSDVNVVVPREQPDGTELLLEPSDHPAVRPYKDALVEDGIPATSFQVDDLDAEIDRLKDTGVSFTQDPMDVGPVRVVLTTPFGSISRIGVSRDVPPRASRSDCAGVCVLLARRRLR